MSVFQQGVMCNMSVIQAVEHKAFSFATVGCGSALYMDIYDVAFSSFIFFSLLLIPTCYVMSLCTARAGPLMSHGG